MILASFLLSIVVLEVNFVQAHADISDENEEGKLYLNKRQVSKINIIQIHDLK